MEREQRTLISLGLAHFRRFAAGAERTQAAGAFVGCVHFRHRSPLDALNENFLSLSYGQSYDCAKSSAPGRGATANNCGADTTPVQTVITVLYKALTMNGLNDNLMETRRLRQSAGQRLRLTSWRPSTSFTHSSVACATRRRISRRRSNGSSETRSDAT